MSRQFGLIIEPSVVIRGSRFDPMLGPVPKPEDRRIPFREVRHASDMDKLLAKDPCIVLVIDFFDAEEEDSQSIRAKCASFKSKLLDYIRRGGVVVLCGCYSGNTNSENMNSFFSAAGLAWKFGSYYRCGHEPTSVGMSLKSETSFDFHSTYCVKAVSLSHVSTSEALYLPQDEASTISLVPMFGGRSVDQKECPVAVGSVGSGCLAYLGDVNNSQGSSVIIGALCVWASAGFGSRSQLVL
eukprot:gnl/Dysnectes_brevis/4601_a6257_759.p1 GENE.gnl/Dysnectes_brevis/4601_a6257_759~~gnl/Dysnectes_brevis/4601_a6257_759.p1  ORF type:complete len:241 (-),score=30.08 gnl/Dysnectes_brevis/4601_a6257_759:31-753(-)